MVTFSADISKTTKNLKMKFWDDNEKNMGFRVTSKKYYFRLSPGDENVIGIYPFNKKRLFPKFQLIPILRLQVMHDIGSALLHRLYGTRRRDFMQKMALIP